eukprot:TRINITY_DN26690_c0_g1_i2.p1 TRINITY_DN26690_c0_g1~~TRINITY_DN26690_c0_g1_i2.p1  ORF type:complete len:441 (+),score=100.24 TRINITY_DN26690_c0_g1_i2:105-1427(+)
MPPKAEAPQPPPQLPPQLPPQQPHWPVPEPPQPSSDDYAHLEESFVLTGRGLAGFEQLRKKLSAYEGQPWVRHIQLNNAVKTGNMTVLRYLVDEVGVQTVNAGTRVGYTALQMAVVWGQLDMIVYLLARGADPLLWKEGGGNVADQARLRQQRLYDFLTRSADLPPDFANLDPRKVEQMYEEGKTMVEVLEGVEAAGSYNAWACCNRRHPLVKRFSWDLAEPEPRRRLIVIRALALQGRATLREPHERAQFAKAVAPSRKATAQKLPLETMAEAMVRLRLGARSRELQDALQASTVADLKMARLSRGEFDSRLKYVAGLSDKEYRRLWRFTLELNDPDDAPSAQSGSAQSAATKPKAKAKAGAAAHALQASSALMATVAKGYKQAAASRASDKKDVAAHSGTASGGAPPLDGDFMEVLFHASLPDSAFMLITRFLLGLRK